MWHDRDEFNFDLPEEATGAVGWVQAVLLLFVAALFVVVVVFAKPAGAAETSFCAAGDMAQQKLLNEYGEVALLEWFEKDGTHRVLFVDPAGESWTLAAVDENGYLCTMRSGSGYETLIDMGQGV